MRAVLQIGHHQRRHISIRHCERSEAIQKRTGLPRSLWSLAMTGLLFIFTLFPAPAHATCFWGPMGDEGEMIYNQTLNVMQYCDGTNWIAMQGGSDGDLRATTCSGGSCNSWVAGSVSGYTDMGQPANPYFFSMSACQEACEGSSNISSSLCSGGACNSWQANRTFFVDDGSMSLFFGSDQASCEAECEMIFQAALCPSGTCSAFQSQKVIGNYDTNASYFAADANDCLSQCDTANDDACSWTTGVLGGCTGYIGAGVTLENQLEVTACSWDAVANQCLGAFGGTNARLVVPSDIKACSYTISTDSCRAYTGAGTTVTPTGSSSPCSSGDAGVVIYNSAEHVHQFCNGTGWVAMVSTPGASTGNGLVHQWNLDENPVATPMADVMGGATGIVTGTMSSGAGKIGNAITLNSMAEYVNVGPISELQGASKFSIAAWLKRTAAGNAIGVGQEDHPGSNIYYTNINFFTDGNLYFQVSTNGNTSNSYGSYALNNTSWHHVVLVFDGTQTGNSNRLKGYVNGSPVALTYTGTIPATAHSQNFDFHIGSYGNCAIGVSCAGTTQNGSVDDVRIYNRPLTAQEVSDLYTCGNAGTCSSTPCGSGNEGTMLYNDIHDVMQYCDGVNWRAIGK